MFDDYRRDRLISILLTEHVYEKLSIKIYSRANRYGNQASPENVFDGKTHEGENSYLPNDYSMMI